MDTEASTVGVLEQATTAEPQEWIGYTYTTQIVTWSYIFTGGLSFVGNLLLLIPILYHRAFRTRKEYIVLAGLAAADMLTGFAYASAGLYRQIKVQVDGSTSSNNVSPDPGRQRCSSGLQFGLTGFECGLMPFNVVWSYSYTTAGVMLSVVTFDRLLVTVATLWYISKGPALAYLLVGLAYAHGIAFGFTQNVAAALTLHDEPAETDLCWQGATMAPRMYSYQMLTFNYGHLVSIGIMAVTLLFYARHNRKTAGAGDVNAAAARAQKEMTSKMARSTVATLCLVVVPVQVSEYVADYLPHDSLQSLFYVPNNLNPLINVYLFLIKHPLMLKGLKKALGGKQGPVQLKDWAATKTTIQTVMPVKQAFTKV